MIAIKEVDRDALRFLWFDDPNECHPKLTMFRFRRLVFGLRPSPSILGFTIKHHHLAKYPQSETKLVEVLENSFYVDDLITGEDSVEESFQIYKGLKQIMATGGFNLRKWHSNSDELLAKIESNELGSEKPPDRSLMQPNCQTFEEDESYAKSTTGHNTIDKADTVKVLVANWNARSDEIIFNFERWNEEATSLPMTKRSLLVLTAKIFDPLGYLVPLTILMKVLFQILCTNKVDWTKN